MLKKQSRNAKIIISILFVFIGLFLISFNYFNQRKLNLINKKNIELYETTIVLTENLEEIDEGYLSSYDEDIIYHSKYVNDYIGILDIDRLNVHRGFVSPDSEFNSVKYNVMVINGSNMPNVKNGNLILAAHRGNLAVAFFNELYRLELNDVASITYNNKKYNYKLVNFYLEDKDGKVTIKRDKNKNILTLITCTKGDKQHQSIYIFELDSIE